MKCQTIIFIGIFCLVPLIEAKRMPGVTRRGNKNNKPSVRRNQHGHEYDDNPLPPVKPKAPEVKKTSPVNTNPSAPAGPPSSHYHAPPPYSPPPAYNPSYSQPPSYSSGYNQPRFGQTPYSQPGGFNNYQPGGYNQFSSPGMGGMPMSGMPMGVMPMAASPYGYGSRSSGMGSGIMTNLFAGLAGYQLAKAFSGGSHHNRDREIIVIDNRSQTPAPVQAINSDQTPPLTVVSPPEPHQYSTEIPQIPPTQVVPTMNEYNYWGFPQYGIPLYGYSLPSQITDYYQTAVISKPSE